MKHNAKNHVKEIEKIYNTIFYRAALKNIPYRIKMRFYSNKQN